MTPLQLQLMERSDKTLSFGCMIKVDHGYYENMSLRPIPNGSIGRLVKYTTPYEGGHCHNFYLKFNKKKDVRYTGSNFCKIIGHPYGFERMMYLKRKSPVDLYGNISDAWSKLDDYRLDNVELWIKPCIDRPEEGQKLVLDFLQTLPDGTTTTNTQ